MLQTLTMRRLLLCFVIGVNVFHVVNSEIEKCGKCVPKDKCEMFGDMSKKDQNKWMLEHPCDTPGEEESGPVFGFAPKAKGDNVCCINSNIWGIEGQPSTPREGMGSRFGDNSHEYHNGDGYNQDNLHKKQNSNINRDDNYNGDVSYEKQRYRPNYRRPESQQYIQGGNDNNGFPTFGPNGIPMSPNPYYGNNYNQQPRRPSYQTKVYNPNPIPNQRQCSVSVLPPDPESGCCGLDLASERMFTAQANYMTRPRNLNDGRFTRNSYSPPYHRQRFTRETPEELGISFDTRIAGGKETDLYQFPWTVLLKTTFDYGNRKGTFNCGGSLISSRYVLTAAHCVTELNARVSNVDVVLAEYDKRTFPRDCVNSPEGRKCIDNVLTHAEKIYSHPDYDDAKLQSDIALIRLSENVPYTDYIRPICLPPIDIDNPEFSNIRLAVAGWGRNGSVPSDLKQSTVVNMVPQRECSRSYPRLNKQHVCASGRTGEDTCKGDSGGPLMMLFNAEYYVSGVVSGKRADAPCGTAVPSLYTNVYQFLPWIKQTIGMGQ